MTKEQIAKNQMALESLSKRFDGMVANINELTRIIEGQEPAKPIVSGALTVAEVARLANCSPMTIKKDIDRGLLKVVHIADRKKIPAKEANAYLNPK